MVTKIVKFDIKPEYIEQFKALLDDDKQGSKNEAGLLEMRLYQDKKSPNLFFAYERFENQAAVDHHSAQTYTKRLLEALAVMCNSAPEVMPLNETTPAPLYEKNPKSANAQDELFIIFFIFKIKPQYRKPKFA